MTKKSESDPKIDVSSHSLVPTHTKLSDDDKNELFALYKITIKELPKIRSNDPAINTLKAKVGDVIKIDRPSKTAKKTVYYRGVSNV